MFTGFGGFAALFSCIKYINIGCKTEIYVRVIYDMDDYANQLRSSISILTMLLRRDLRPSFFYFQVFILGHHHMFIILWAVKR